MTNFPENVRILGHFLSGFCQDFQDIGVAQGRGHPDIGHFSIFNSFFAFFAKILKS